MGIYYEDKAILEALKKLKGTTAINEEKSLLNMAYNNGIRDTVNFFMDIITGDVPEGLKIPAAEVRPVIYAKWERHYHNDRPGVLTDLFWHCSACDYSATSTDRIYHKFCPGCGAKMEGIE